MTDNRLPFASSAPASVLQGLNRVNARLDRVLVGLRGHADAEREVRQIAQELVTLVERDTDISLACLYLNQIGGRYVIRHCIETAVVAVVVARAMGKAPGELLTISAAALTMNAGMLRQMESFDGHEVALTSAERAMVRRHPVESADLLRSAGVTDEEWLDCVLMHHENDDGSGYPEGRRGDEIPASAKLIGLADRYCACVSARNYRRSMLPPLALRTLAGENADAGLLRHFGARIGEYPPGTLVRLENGDVGVMARHSSVHVLRGTGGPGCAIAEALHEDQAGIRFSMKSVWGPMAAL